jgi:hypothetical protein
LGGISERAWTKRISWPISGFFILTIHVTNHVPFEQSPLLRKEGDRFQAKKPCGRKNLEFRSVEETANRARR